jgi:phosphoribosyl-AMP cyclohydrolase
MHDRATWADLQWDDHGLIPAVVQDDDSGAVLMVAWMDRQALQLTLASGETHFWSRSRRELWHKGATSGNIQQVLGVWADCDGDTLLIRVRPAGPACHTGEVSCFYRRFADSEAGDATDASPAQTITQEEANIE